MVLLSTKKKEEVSPPVILQVATIQVHELITLYFCHAQDFLRTRSKSANIPTKRRDLSNVPFLFLSLICCSRDGKSRGGLGGG
jgi:hypothetical protein